MSAPTVLYGASTTKRVRRSNAELADVDRAIIEAVEADSPVTLRGVYYRAVSMGAVDKTESGYRLVGRQLLKLRRRGKIKYSYITDGTRWITKPNTWTDLEEMLEVAARSYRRARWHRQPVEVQIFTEKDAISGVIEPITARWDVPLGVLRGYASESFAWSVADSIAYSLDEGEKQGVYVYQLGDHDPSGVDAWRDFTNKVQDFLIAMNPPSGEVHFERLAVTEEQIEDWDLPTRPTKRSDSRARRFSGGSVEVDAIPAPRLRELVEDAITMHIDQEQLRIDREAERSERDVLTAMRGAA